MKVKLYYLLSVLTILMFGCHKKHDVLPDEPGDGINYVTKIDTVKVIHISADTSYVFLSPLVGTFVPPVHSMKLDNIFEETFDSLHLSIQRNNKVKFDDGVILPKITFELEGQNSFTFPYNTVKIKSYQTEKSFPSPIPPTSFRRSTSSKEINGYVLKRHYERVSFTANLELIAKDEKGNTVKLTGQLKGSKVGGQYYNISLY